jgi:hypothetical protein
MFLFTLTLIVIKAGCNFRQNKDSHRNLLKQRWKTFDAFVENCKNWLAIYFTSASKEKITGSV